MIQIAFIGIDGSGKSSLSRLVSQKLGEKGVRTKLMSMKKYNSKVIECIEHLNPSIISEEMKLLGYTFDILSQYFDTFHMDDEIVIWDRHIYCLQAYFTELNINLPWQQKMLLSVSKPDGVFLLDVDSKTAVERLRTRNQKEKPLENEQYLGAVRERYLKLYQENGFILLDSHKPLDILEDEVLHHLQYIWSKEE